MPTFPAKPYTTTLSNLPPRSGTSISVAQPEASQSSPLNDLCDVLAGFYKKTVAAGHENNVPSVEEMPSTCFKREEGNPKQATITYTKKESGEERHCIIESSIETMGNIAAKAGQYAALRQQIKQHGAQRLDKNEHGFPATRIIPHSNSSRIYHLQHGLSKETGEMEPVKEDLGAGGYARVRHACLEDTDKGTMSNVAVKKFIPDPYSDDPYECVRNAEHEFSMYQFLDDSRYIPKVYDLMHVEKDGKFKSSFSMELMEGDNGEVALGKTKHLPVAEARKEIKAAARKYTEITAYFEEKGVVQTDFELKNLFHESSGEIKAFDFGLMEKLEDVGAGFRNANRNKLAKILGAFLTSGLANHSQDSDAVNDIQSLKAMSRKLLKGEISPKELLDEAYFQAD